MKVTNATDFPNVYYGLHFAPGVAEYREPGKSPYRVFINENTAKKMDPTFAGKPVYVQHVDEVDLKNIQSEADGFVFDSFYNRHDGKHWVRFIAVSDKAKDAIRSGWTLSNAYFPTSKAGGGTWHGVEYQNEIMEGEYEHLAIVKDPRYTESVILTCEQFKTYNENKDLELKRLSNSQNQEKLTMLNLFKRTKVENSADLENTMVELPKSKKQMTILEIVNEYDKVVNMHGYASPDHMVKVNDSEEYSVKDLVKKHQGMAKEMEEMKKANEEIEEPEEGKELAEEKEKKLYPDKKKNELEEPKEEKTLEEITKGKENFKKLKNAPEAKKEEVVQIMLVNDKVAKGKSLFGSN